MAKVLGLSFFFHDSAAAMVCEGKILAAAAEERFCRRKHTSEFPKLAVEYCLEAAGIDHLNDLNAIVFYEKPIVKLFRAVETMVQTWPRSFQTYVQKLPALLATKVNIRQLLHEQLPGYEGPVYFSEHHLSHAASAFYCSPFEEAAILTVDGVGEWETAALGFGRGKTVRLDRSIHFPHSIGLLYSALTSYLGFKVNDGEWKVMGLAPYGKPVYQDAFRKLVELYEDGSFRLNMNYFAFPYSPRWTTDHTAWKKLFGFARREPGAPLEQCHEDLARSGQEVIEEVILNLARAAHAAYPTDNLVIAGGVGLNCVANWKIQHEGVFQNVWIQPAAGDDGAALGAALIVAQSVFEDPRCAPMSHAYLGPEFSKSDICDFLERSHIPYEWLSDEELVERIAGQMAEGKVVGWCRGRMEFGPRSLGSRSILANPTHPDMKTIVNTKIKFREYFRPFAPAIPLEHVHEYFEVPQGSDMPFMLKTPSVRVEKRMQIPAVTHEDGSGRVQTVRESDNPVFYRLLKAMAPRTGVPVLLNTSFNVRGEPIVCTPKDAYECFLKTDLDVLVLGNALVTCKPKAEIDFQAAYRDSDALEWDEEVESKVLNFYKELPFNYYSNAVDNAKELLRKNRIRSYPEVHDFLRHHPAKVIDVGCGAGWFSHSCSFFYGSEVVGLDLNPVALRQAMSVGRLIPQKGKAEFIQGNLFDYDPGPSFDLVNSLGALHHTPDCHAAIQRCFSWVKKGGVFPLRALSFIWQKALFGPLSSTPGSGGIGRGAF